MPHPRIFAAFASLAACVAAGCATTQTVRIQCVPREVEIYVDGRQIDGNEAALRTDRAHKIYAKGPGFEPQLVVLEPEVGEDGRPAFRDEDLCVQLVPIGMKRELEVEVEREAGASAR